MKRPITLRLTMIFVLVAASIVFLLRKPLTLGLDLQGGMHLVLEVDGEKAVEGTVERTYTAIKETLEAKKITIEAIQKTGTTITFSTPPESDLAVIKILENYTLWKVKHEGKERVLTLKEPEIKQILENATSQALEILRNRVDQFGVAEPLIQKQGEDQILVQLPGVKDPKRAIDLIGKTALLEFKLVDDDNPLAKLLPATIPADEEEKTLNEFRDKVPEGSQILFERIVDAETQEVTKQPYLVKREAALTGAVLSDARVVIGDLNEPQTTLAFDPVGAQLFEKITGENLQKRLAIVLDNTIYSAPVIQQKITGGRAQISGSLTTQEASDLAIVLRAGALPAPVHILQNVTVGPSLGKDSIAKGIRTSIVSGILVMLYMIFYYRLSGLLADFALSLNLLLLLGALSALDATLTLPGIAAIVLTIGMAVDTNVIIYERIREELKKGRPIRLAVHAGYDRAFPSILDSHVTTLITALALFLFGTGPIKGFAVSLSLGVMINLFTALVGTRVVFDFFNQQWRLTRLSI